MFIKNYRIVIFPLFQLLIFILFYFTVKASNTKEVNVNNSDVLYYDNLFNSIEHDYYNLSEIFNYSIKEINKIKIKHKSKNMKFKKDICILGVLCNDKGLQIENSMLSWLLPEYDVYSVYQKFPGILYEYPALRFAQWLTLINNESIILYVHTKGSFYQRDEQNQVRELWKHEFTKNRKKIYIQLLKNNYTDVTAPFRYGSCTWFNGMFISYRAFNLIDEIKYYPNYRWHYENLFINSINNSNNIRLKGILNDNITAMRALPECIKFLNLFKKEEQQMIVDNKKIILMESFLLSFIYIFIKKYKNLFIS